MYPILTKKKVWKNVDVTINYGFASIPEKFPGLILRVWLLIIYIVHLGRYWIYQTVWCDTSAPKYIYLYTSILIEYFQK